MTAGCVDLPNTARYRAQFCEPNSDLFESGELFPGFLSTHKSSSGHSVLGSRIPLPQNAVRGSRGSCVEGRLLRSSLGSQLFKSFDRIAHHRMLLAFVVVVGPSSSLATPSRRPRSPSRRLCPRSPEQHIPITAAATKLILRRARLSGVRDAPSIPHLQGCLGSVPPLSVSARRRPAGIYETTLAPRVYVVRGAMARNAHIPGFHTGTSRRGPRPLLGEKALSPISVGGAFRASSLGRYGCSSTFCSSGGSAIA